MKHNLVFFKINCYIFFQRKFAKFIGICNELDSDVNRCLKAERKSNQSANLQKARERQEKLKELMKNNL